VGGLRGGHADICVYVTLACRDRAGKQGWVTGSAKAAVHGKPGRPDSVGTTVESHLHSGRTTQRVAKSGRLRPGLVDGGRGEERGVVGG